MQAWAALLLALGLAGCASVSPPACPAGQEYLRKAQIFFGRPAEGPPSLGEVDFLRFVDEELTPRFPDGLTILDGGGQWRGDENRQIREAAKVVLIVLPPGREAAKRIEEARAAYAMRFHQDSEVVVGKPACVSF